MIVLCIAFIDVKYYHRGSHLAHAFHGNDFFDIIKCSDRCIFEIKKFLKMHL